MPGVRRTRNLEGRLRRDRGPEVALPILRQEVQLPHRDRIVMRNTVWVDETYISNTDLSKGYGQARKRGLSRQKLCICVAIDIHKNPVEVVCGHGKPSSARVRDAMGGRIVPGSLLIHDLK